MDVVIYARVSTKTQDYDRQLSELRTYAARMQYNVVREFAEVVSGAKKVNEREAMSELLTYCDDNHVDKVLIYECSRLSRRSVDFLQIVEYLNERNISIHSSVPAHIQRQTDADFSTSVFLVAGEGLEPPASGL